MGEIAGFVCFMLWLGLGGWAYGVSSKGAEDDNPAAFLVCLALGPAVAGLVIGLRWAPKSKAAANPPEDAKP